MGNGPKPTLFSFLDVACIYCNFLLIYPYLLVLLVLPQAPQAPQAPEAQAPTGQTPTQQFQRPQIEMPTPGVQAPTGDNFWENFSALSDKNPQAAWQLLSQATPDALRSKVLVSEA